MEFIRDIHQRAQAANRPVISIEFFPPKTPETHHTLLHKTIPQLTTLKPDYCSVTYGAGGTTQQKTLQITQQIQQKHHLTAMSHLTCVNATQTQLRAYLDKTHAAGIKNILALRGDPPAGTTHFQPTPGGCQYAYQLVQLIKSYNTFSIGVAGFPEGHLTAKNKQTDWQHLKTKAQAGADFIITQLFFDNTHYFQFRDYLQKKTNLQTPIYPGILPILSTTQIKRFTQLCGATIPPKMMTKLTQLQNDNTAVTQYGIDYATQQCRNLLDAGAPGIHFYTLNKPHSTQQIIKNLALQPTQNQPPPT